MSLLRIKSLKKTYLRPRAFKEPLQVQALRGVDLELNPGETLAVVGESGCGKSTLAKLLMKVEVPTAGSVTIQDRDLSSMTSKELPAHLQMIFQDPYSSINPRKKIFDIIAEPLKIRGENAAYIQNSVQTVAKTVGLRPEILSRYAHMLSGGQRQRVGIARALVTEPKVIVCDEPVSALDVSVQAQVLNLLLDLQVEKKISYLFISHDLGVVRFLAHRVAVMYLGKIVETSTRDVIFTKPMHPYTQLLLNSTPTMLEKPEETFEKMAVDLPSPTNPPSGCGFRTRCPYVQDRCASEAPSLRPVTLKGQTSSVACHFAEQISEKN
jgi:oligopeptide/dipeptide ABC transporter ATP-binding protein